jgi:hypothetical protein
MKNKVDYRQVARRRIFSDFKAMIRKVLGHESEWSLLMKKNPEVKIFISVLQVDYHFKLEPIFIF